MAPALSTLFLLLGTSWFFFSLVIMFLGGIIIVLAYFISPKNYFILIGCKPNIKGYLIHLIRWLLIATVLLLVLISLIMSIDSIFGLIPRIRAQQLPIEEAVAISNNIVQPIPYLIPNNSGIDLPPLGIDSRELIVTVNNISGIITTNAYSHLEKAQDYIPLNAYSSSHWKFFTVGFFNQADPKWDHSLLRLRTINESAIIAALFPVTENDILTVGNIVLTFLDSELSYAFRKEIFNSIIITINTLNRISNGQLWVYCTVDGQIVSYNFHICIRLFKSILESHVDTNNTFNEATNFYLLDVIRDLDFVFTRLPH